MSPDQTPPGQDRPVTIELDGVNRESPTRRQTGRGIRQLGPTNRVDGFETQEINEKGKKIRTIRDDETIELHPNQRFRTVPNEGGPGGPPEWLATQVEELTRRSGITFNLTSGPVPGTALYVVWADEHPLPARYNLDKATLGFRVPVNCPDAAPEDQFFIRPVTVRLREPDPVRKATELNRAAANNSILGGQVPGDPNVLVFSWHIWNNKPWSRTKHTLFDHYAHCLRRLEDVPEHD